MKLMLQNEEAEYYSKNKTIESVFLKRSHLSSNAEPYLSNWKLRHVSLKLKARLRAKKIVEDNKAINVANKILTNGITY